VKARVWLLVSAVVLAAFIVVAATNHSSRPQPSASDPRPTPPTSPIDLPTTSSFTDHQAPSMAAPSSSSTAPPSTPATTTTTAPAAWHPAPVFRGRLLVAYYGTAGTGAMGVLGSAPIPDVTHQLRQAARGFAEASGRKVQIVYELIATIADGSPGSDGSYSHDIPRADVQAFLTAARRNHALVVLDLQPGRSDFLTVAKRYAWALKQPNVGMALDPEWRMHGDDVPGQEIGWVGADEVNATAKYVASIARQYRLPQKLFLLHQFVPKSLDQIQDITPEKGLAMVQHVDGYGAEADKLATFHNVARPKQFILGFKLFYQEDVGLMSPSRVVAAVPDVRFISYQ
jgi:hypothetical protein